MRKLMATIFRSLPKRHRIRLIRHLSSVPAKALSKEFTVKRAESREELEEAYRLLYQCYRQMGLIDVHPSELRCTPYSVLPETTTVIVKQNDQIVGTVSLIMDSPFGLPSDQSYLSQNNQLRTNSHKLCEVSALAVHKNFRESGHTVSLLLMKYLYNYCRTVNASHLVCTIHPRARDFYEALWGFESDGSIVEYEYVNNAKAIHMYSPLSDENCQKVLGFFPQDDLRSNPALFVITHDDRFHYPDFSNGKVFTPVMGPDLLEYFFLLKTDLFASLTEHQRTLFFEIYTHYFNNHQMGRFLELKQPELDRRINYRVPVQLPCSLKLQGQNVYRMGVIRDISENGTYVHFVSSDHLDLAFESIQFTLDQIKWNLPVEKKWSNPHEVFRLGTGVGFSFKKIDVKLSRVLKKLNYPLQKIS